MPDIWTHCNSQLNRDLEPVVERANENWQYVKNFTTFPQLHQWLNTLNVSGQVGTFVINCHGNFGGRLLLDQVISHQSAESLFIERFRPLQNYIARDGHLWFTGCAMADRDEGTQLMQSISRQLPDRVIIGHDRLSYNPTIGVPYAAGNIIMRDLVEITDISQAGLLEGRVHKLHPATKWMRNERVLRYPRDEQRNRPGMRCAYPLCRGHSDANHQCDGSWDPGCEWRGSPRTQEIRGNPSFLYYTPDDPTP